MDDLITFLVNSEKPHDAAMRNTGTGFVVFSHHSLLLQPPVPAYAGTEGCYRLLVFFITLL